MEQEDKLNTGTIRLNEHQEDKLTEISTIVNEFLIGLIDDQMSEFVNVHNYQLYQIVLISIMSNFVFKVCQGKHEKIDSLIHIFADSIKNGTEMIRRGIENEPKK